MQSQTRRLQQLCAGLRTNERAPAVANRQFCGADGVPVITDIKSIKTAPYGTRLVVVKVTTSSPGLTGVGCATFTQRPTPVCVAVDEYLRPFLLGRRVTEIEDIWQAAYVSSYWRSGPVLNNALSGVDQALWDIKGKLAGMPVHDLLGGKTRKAAPVYVHASGDSFEEVCAEARKFMDMGFRTIRMQCATKSSFGGADYGASKAYSNKLEDKVTESANRIAEAKAANSNVASDGPTDQQGLFVPDDYLLQTPALFKYARETLGNEVELCHDTHERLTPSQAVYLAKELEQYRLFFLEDSLPPEQNDHFRLIRQHSTVPIAMGELFVNIHEYRPRASTIWITRVISHNCNMTGICRTFQDPERLRDCFLISESDPNVLFKNVHSTGQVRALDQRAAHRLHPGSHVRYRWADADAEARDAVRVLRGADGAARAGRLLAGGDDGELGDPVCLELWHPGVSGARRPHHIRLAAAAAAAA
eukprot:19886_2